VGRHIKQEVWSEEPVMDGETILRLGAFFGIFAAMALWETLAPKRVRLLTRGQRWLTNWGISVVNTGVTVLLKTLLGAAAVLASLSAADQGIGLFNHVGWPVWLEVLIAFVVLDFAIWFQHLISHKVPLLWRLHRVHHADRDVDVTTAIRFHPVEIALSMLFKIALVYALGVSVVAVILFEVILNGAAMFNHANIRLPQAVDRWVRLAIVTPDMHRIHHSVERAEHDANYGFNLSVWDRLFGTYIDEAGKGEPGLVLGLSEHQTTDPARLTWSLAFPFRR
jgi:sterol desaturase/sphingolipid hydroxylase (fatty acid hydroxylase superfamily)